MEQILVVEDEPDIIHLVSYNLRKEGFSVAAAPDGAEALRLVRKGGIDLVILDLMLPGMNGLDVCRIIRHDRALQTLPIIMLTAKGEETDKVQGLESGADDYLTKPFGPKELIARVKALLRRSGGKLGQESIIRIGDLEIDKNSYRVAKKGRRIDLSATEFRLLVFLAERKGRVFSREQLLDVLWKDEAFVESRTVDVHIRRLRMQIETDPANPEHVKTRRGVGYYMEIES